MYQMIKEGALADDIRISDILKIHTRRSIYEFFVVDPVKLKGWVTGGVVGAVAKLGFVCQPKTVTSGAKAQLMIESPKGLRYITTSRITSLKHYRSK
jgi:hypothetical protein